MIQKLQKKYIRTTMISGISLMLMLVLIINIANFALTDSSLREMLVTIEQSQTRMDKPLRGDEAKTAGEPERPEDDDADDAEKEDSSDEEKEIRRQNARLSGRFGPEAAYAARYFVLHYDDDGNLHTMEMDRIASVTKEEAQSFLMTAVAHGEGFGYTGHYKYYVVRHGENRWQAIFMDVYSELSALTWVVVISAAALLFSILMMYFVVVRFSRRAVDPVIKNIETQKRFITDASHELKTPVTVISTNLTVLEMEVGQNKWIDKSRRQTEKLGELVNSLVSLAKMDEEKPELVFKKFNISAAAKETMESFADFAESKGHALLYEIQPDLEYNGDEYLIRRLLSVLLDNAVKYASDGAPIAFKLRKAKRGVVMEMSNAYAGERIRDYDKLFERFYRADESRSSKGGFGIGLSLAQSIAQAHHGQITAGPAEPDQIVFTVELK